MESRKTYTEGPKAITIASPYGSAVPYVSEEEQHRLIVENWESFAAAGFDGFRQFGAGVIVVEENALDPTPEIHPFGRHKIWYATGFDAWLKEGRLVEEIKRLEEQMRQYDPAHVCLFLFLSEEEVAQIYVVESTLNPSTALARIKAMLN